jgi:hypothetical protein
MLLLKKNRGMLLETGLEKDFQGKTSKAQITKAKIDKWGFQSKNPTYSLGEIYSTLLLFP